MIVWTSDLQDGDSGGIFGQLFDKLGFKSGSEFQVNAESFSSQIGARVASFPDGNFVVVWQSFGQDGDVWGCFGRSFSGMSN